MNFFRSSRRAVAADDEFCPRSSAWWGFAPFVVGRSPPSVRSSAAASSSLSARSRRQGARARGVRGGVVLLLFFCAAATGPRRRCCARCPPSSFAIAFVALLLLLEMMDVPLACKGAAVTAAAIGAASLRVAVSASRRGDVVGAAIAGSVLPALLVAIPVALAFAAAAEAARWLGVMVAEASCRHTTILDDPRSTTANHQPLRCCAAALPLILLFPVARLCASACPAARQGLVVALPACCQAP